MKGDSKEPQPDKPKARSIGYWMAIGVALGAGIGVAMDNLPIGVAIGVALGAAIGTAQAHRNKNQ